MKIIISVIQVKAFMWCIVLFFCQQFIFSLGTRNVTSTRYRQSFFEVQLGEMYFLGIAERAAGNQALNEKAGFSQAVQRDLLVSKMLERYDDTFF